MKKRMKLLKNKITFTLLIVCTLLTYGSFDITVLAQNELANNENTEEQMEPVSSNIEWRFKVIDGVLYKRQYNTSTKEWIGDWIRV